MRRHVTCVSRYFIASLDIFVFAHTRGVYVSVYVSLSFLFLFILLCVCYHCCMGWWAKVVINALIFACALTSRCQKICQPRLNFLYWRGSDRRTSHCFVPNVLNFRGNPRPLGPDVLQKEAKIALFSISFLKKMENNGFWCQQKR